MPRLTESDMSRPSELVLSSSRVLLTATLNKFVKDSSKTTKEKFSIGLHQVLTLILLKGCGTHMLKGCGRTRISRHTIPTEGCTGERIPQNCSERYQISLFMHERTAVIDANGGHSHCELLSSDLILGCGYISLLLPN